MPYNSPVFSCVLSKSLESANVKNTNKSMNCVPLCFTCTVTHACTKTNPYTHVCAYICLNTHTHTHTCTHTHTHVCTHTHAHTHMCTHKHTHNHMCAPTHRFSATPIVSLHLSLFSNSSMTLSFSLSTRILSLNPSGQINQIQHFPKFQVQNGDKDLPWRAHRNPCSTHCCEHITQNFEFR